MFVLSKILLPYTKRLLIDAGIASEEEVLKTPKELEEFTFREDSILGMPRIFRYVAVKQV